jgi:hypothetical protein
MGYKPTKEECSDIIRVGKSFSEKICRRQASRSGMANIGLLDL